MGFHVGEMVRVLVPSMDTDGLIVGMGERSEYVVAVQGFGDQILDESEIRVLTEAEAHEFHGGAAGSFRSEGCSLCPEDVPDETVRNQVMATLKGWTGNRADSPATIEVTEDLAREFMASRYYDPDAPIGRVLPIFLCASDGKNLAWDPDIEANRNAIGDLYDLVRMIEKGVR